MKDFVASPRKHLVESQNKEWKLVGSHIRELTQIEQQIGRAENVSWDVILNVIWICKLCKFICISMQRVPAKFRPKQKFYNFCIPFAEKKCEMWSFFSENFQQICFAKKKFAEYLSLLTKIKHFLTKFSIISASFRIFSQKVFVCWKPYLCSFTLNEQVPQ